MMVHLWVQAAAHVHVHVLGDLHQWGRKQDGGGLCFSEARPPPVVPTDPQEPGAAGGGVRFLYVHLSITGSRLFSFLFLIPGESWRHNGEFATAPLARLEKESMKMCADTWPSSTRHELIIKYQHHHLVMERAGAASVCIRGGAGVSRGCK